MPLLALLALLPGCFLLDGQVNAPADPADDTPVVFEVTPGSTARALGPRLAADGLIEDDWVWQYYLRSAKAGSCLKAGKFELRRSMTMPEIMETLCGPPLADDVPFTVVEGWRIREIDAALVEAGFIEAGAYAKAAGDPSRFTLPFGLSGLSTLEGLLYPETYKVPRSGFEVDTFIQRQLDTFAARFPEGGTDAVKGRGLYAVVIMASMLEREEPRPDQRNLVAGILWKRLDGKWNLGVDATSRYTLADWNDRQAFLVKLRDPDDPYNTRLRGGLPPTPIGNPVDLSLRAAIQPEGSEYWYYLHDKEGVLHPSRNAAEHERYRKQYGIW